VDALHEQVGGDEDVFVVGIFEDGAVIADTFDGFGVLQFDVLRQSFDEAKFA
jgi:hypothetical protein